jgi:hypothetical protein
MKKLLIVCTLNLISIIAFCQQSQSDSLIYNEVIFPFKKAIEEKDSISFNQLFFDKKVPFVGIMSKKTEWSIKKDYSDFEGVAVSNHKKFITEICISEKKQKEEFYNIEVSQDNYIASVSFNYAYYSGLKMIQWGLEKWNLVKVNKKWLITDVIYTIRFPDIEPFPFVD